MAAIDLKQLGLRPREIQVLRWARQAWSLVPNGHALVSDNGIKSAERLIARGFLTKAPDQLAPPFGIVVVMTPENFETIARAAEAR